MPYGEELKDGWTWRIPGGFFPAWLVRACRGDRTFWRENDIDGESEHGEVMRTPSGTPHEGAPMHELALDAKFRAPSDEGEKVA